MPTNAIPLPEPVYYQWRRLNMPWSLEFAFDSRCHATTDDSEVRTLHTADQMHAHAAAVSAAKDAEIERLRAQLHLAEVVRASQAEGLTQGAAGWRERANQLEAEVAGLEQLVCDAAYTLESARIWGGMEWAYNPLHPFKYLPMLDRLNVERARINDKRAALEKP